MQNPFDLYSIQVRTATSTCLVVTVDETSLLINLATPTFQDIIYSTKPDLLIETGA